MAKYGLNYNYQDPLANMMNWGNSPIANYGLSSNNSYLSPSRFSLTDTYSGNSGMGLNPNASGIGMKAPTTGFWTNNGASNILGSGGNSGSGSITEFLGKNKDSIGAGLDILQSLGGLYGTFQGMNLAKKQFNFTKQMAEKNLANQTKSYNSDLEKRERLNLAASGLSQEDKDKHVKEYLDKHKL